jgi:alpha-tubulin suppressor-like RCC1 family protein
VNATTRRTFASPGICDDGACRYESTDMPCPEACVAGACVAAARPGMMASGGQHTCFLTGAGGVKCWGNNQFGELGDGTTMERSGPVDVVGLSSGVLAVVSNRFSSCALLRDAVKCWGSGLSGQLGDGTFFDHQPTPQTVLGLEPGVQALAAGSDHTCALTAAGGVRCWGAGTLGQLGDATATTRNRAVDVEGLATGVMAIGAGAHHSCAATGAGAKCWGDNTWSQLADGTGGDGVATQKNAPVDVMGLGAGVTAFAGGLDHTCAIASGAVLCWGRNRHGEIGDGTFMYRRTPVSVPALAAGVRAITAAEYHTCAVTVDRAAMCWGFNSNGQLGIGSMTDQNAPTGVVGLDAGVQHISAGFDDLDVRSHTCAVSDASAMCWGSNLHSELGDGTRMTRTSPTPVLGL